MSAEKETVYQMIMAIIRTYVYPVSLESFRLLPDSLVLGTAILAGLSMCTSYSVLLFTMFELMIGQRIFASIIGGISPVGAGPDALNIVCLPGFNYPNTMRISLLETIGKPSFFPSPVIFFLTGIFSYMLGSIQEFKREIQSLGGDLSVRTLIGVVLSTAFAFVMLAFRYSHGCESFGTLLLSLIMGAIAGFAIVFQNKLIFGRVGINILNLPLIQTAEERGKPMYVCAPST
jgi:hypothetical protein